ncbi:MAG: hypothetical protein II565_09995 [Fibrobacter sp.]|jgi:hypothetical protein|nr:hypothetical protein [Fibrobacter sp.]MBQ5464645.1 hypothetical protein [Fibrobacter sp.]
MQSWTEIKNIENPTEEQQLEAIGLNWYAISLIQNPTETVQKAAFAKNEQAILYVKCGPCEALKESLNAMDESTFLRSFKAEPNLLKFITNPLLLKAAVSQDWKIVRKIDDASDELWAEAVRQSAEALKFIRHPGEKVLVAAIERDWKYLQEIENPTAAVVVAAVKQDYHAFEYVSIRRRTEAVQLAAVRTDWRCIQYLQRASENVQMEAVRQSKEALKLIKNPFPAVKEFCA